MLSIKSHIKRERDRDIQFRKELKRKIKSLYCLKITIARENFNIFIVFFAENRKANTYDEPSELEIEWRLPARVGTTSIERCMEPADERFR